MNRLILLTALLPLLVAPACDDGPSSVVSPAVQTWVAIEPTQCGGSPWERRNASLEEYLARTGVGEFEVARLRIAENVCLSCACPTGERVCVNVSQRVVPLLQRDGFQEVAAGECTNTPGTPPRPS